MRNSALYAVISIISLFAGCSGGVNPLPVGDTGAQVEEPDSVPPSDTPSPPEGNPTTLPSNEPLTGTPAGSGFPSAVVSATPVNSSVDNVLQPIIEVEFEDWDDVLNSAIVTISPQVSGTTRIEPSIKKIRYIVSDDLQPNQEYTVTITVPVEFVPVLVASWRFRTIGVFGVRSVFPPDGSYAALTTPIRFEYSDSAGLMRDIQTVLTVGGGIGGTTFNGRSGEWTLPRPLNDNTTYQAELAIRYTDQGGESRLTNYRWDFLTTDLWKAYSFETSGVTDKQDRLHKIVIGEVSGDFYTVGTQSLGADAYPNLWFMRMDTGGTIKWEKIFDGYSFHERPYGIAVDETAGEIFITATSMKAGLGENNQMLLKYTTAGRYVWKAVYNTSSSTYSVDAAHDVAIDSDTAYIAGYYARSGSEGKDISIRSFRRSDGAPVWGLPSEGSVSRANDDEARAIAAAADAIYVAGYVEGVRVGSRYMSKQWLGRFNKASGLIEAEWISPEAGENEMIHDIDISSDGKIYTVGKDGDRFSWSIFRFDGAALSQDRNVLETAATEGRAIAVKDMGGTRNIFAGGLASTNGFIRIYGDDGSVISTPSADIGSSSVVRGVAVDNDGTFAAAGHLETSAFIRRYGADSGISRTISYNGTNTGVTLATSALASHDGGLLVGSNFLPGATVVKKYALDGTAMWSVYDRYRASVSPATYRTYNTMRLAAGINGSILVCGTSSSAPANSNVFVDKLDPDGSPLWPVPYLYDFEGSYDFCYAAVSDDEGFIYIGGQFTRPREGALRVGFVTKLCPDGTFDPSRGSWQRIIDYAGGTVDSVYGLYLVPDGKIFVAGTSVNMSVSPPTNHLFFYLINQSDGLNSSGLDNPLYESAAESVSKGTAIDRDNKVVFSYVETGSSNNKLCRLSSEGVVSCFAELDVPYLTIQTIGEDGTIYAIQRVDDDSQMGADIYQGPRKNSSLVAITPNGPVLFTTPLLEGTLDSIYHAALLPDSSIAIVGGKFVGDSGRVGTIMKCDTMGNCRD